MVFPIENGVIFQLSLCDRLPEGMCLVGKHAMPYVLPLISGFPEISNRTHVSRTPKKPEYLIARSQLTWSVGPLGFGPIQFLMKLLKMNGWKMYFPMKIVLYFLDIRSFSAGGG